MEACRRKMAVPATRCQPDPISVVSRWGALSAPSVRSAHRCTTAPPWSTRWPKTVTMATNRSIVAAARRCPMSAVQVVRSRRIRCAASHWCKDISTRDSARIRSLLESASSVSAVMHHVIHSILECVFHYRCEYGCLCVSLCRLDHRTTCYPYCRPLCSGQGRRTSTVSMTLGNFYFSYKYFRNSNLYQREI